MDSSSEVCCSATGQVVGLDQDCAACMRQQSSTQELLALMSTGASQNERRRAA